MKKRFSCVFGLALCAALALAGCGKIEKDQCKDNLMKTSFALRTYLMENGNGLPTPEALEKGRTAENGVSVCPGTKKQYEFLIPANTQVDMDAMAKDTGNPKYRAIRCPEHGYVLYLYGGVEEEK